MSKIVSKRAPSLRAFVRSASFGVGGGWGASGPESGVEILIYGEHFGGDGIAQAQFDDDLDYSFNGQFLGWETILSRPGGTAPSSAAEIPIPD